MNITTNNVQDFLNCFSNTKVIIGCRDVQGNFLGATDYHAYKLNHKSASDLVGKNLTDLDEQFADKARARHTEDLRIIQENKSSKSLSFSRDENDTLSCLLTQKSVYHIDNEPSAIIGHSTEMSTGIVAQLCQLLFDTDKLLDDKDIFIKPIALEDYDQYAFSKREQECLFYLIRGKSAKKIAQIYNISPKTVEQYINRIKTKMSCKSSPDVIEKAINNGWLYRMPEWMSNYI